MKQTLIHIFVMMVDITIRVFVLRNLWSWFAVTKFNLPDIDYIYSLGAILIATTISNKIYSGHFKSCTLARSKSSKGYWVIARDLFIQPTIIIIIGWIAKEVYL